MHENEVTAVVLAGGEGRRMGGRDKGWESFAGEPLITHVVNRLAFQAGCIAINANRSLERYRALGYPLINDRESGYHGPLMGMWSALCAVDTPWALFVPCDSPALPADLALRLQQGLGDRRIAVAHDGQRAYPVVALIDTALRDDLGAALRDGERKIDRWYARHPWCHVDFSDQPEAFANLNSSDDRDVMERRWRSSESF
ncbi:MULTISPECIES: molybdenum cofactor guanylyltransferase MobA [unclassified Chromohalobacter]|uniref:molybdenum cofactor guanylyltransferase MobA n=1 Tax=unclassified Chromohalobacter TaxID=2628571 RepID=UPI0024695432|nr:MULTISPECIES: molybdenum cofactor guanylyltransferase MobA [unclassified Chromohalobacter]